MNEVTSRNPYLDGVPVEGLLPRGGEGHGDDPVCRVGGRGAYVIYNCLKCVWNLQLSMYLKETQKCPTYLWHTSDRGQIRLSGSAACFRKSEERNDSGLHVGHSDFKQICPSLTLPSSWWLSPALSSALPVWKPSRGLLFSRSAGMSQPWWKKTNIHHYSVQ